MADCSDVDSHPARECSSFLDTGCPCNIDKRTMKDPRERHVVCKLDRYQLEDRYLRLLEEVQALKKLSNGQEDKIKRLATKLMRFGANPRTCIAAIDLTADHDKLSLLEAENAKLKDKINVLRSQLINNKTFGRSTSRGRRLTNGSTSGPITCRSESSRLKTPSCQCMNARPGNDEHDVQNYTLKIQEMEAEKKDMMSRITDLEVELACYASGSRREKVAENVEYIRVWRQMKRQNEKLVAAETANETLNEQIHKLKNHLEECSKSKEQVSAELAAERKQVAQLDESVSRYKDTQVNLRDKDEMIMDLSNELEILQEHNRELLELSAKFGKVEQENAECKRKIAEQLGEQQLLKDALSKEKANMAALQAANEQLLAKLHELQKNIDVMTIQLMGPKEKQAKLPLMNSNEDSHGSSSSGERITSNKELLKENPEFCKECCNNLKTKRSNQREKGVQASEKLRLINETTQTDKLLDSAKSKENASVENYDKNKIQVPRNGNSLSREGMLKLLEQVQISTPLESQNTARIRHMDASSVPVRVSRQVSNLESLLFGDSGF